MKLQFKPLIRITAQALIAAFFLALAGGAQALTWGPTGGGGGGIWDTNTSTLNWYDGVSAVGWPNSGGDDAVFAGTAGIVTNRGGTTPLYVQNMTFNTANYIVTNGTLTLSGSAPTVNNGVNATIYSVVAGTGTGLSKTGAGTLTLSNANTYTGGTYVNGGWIKAGNNNAFGANGSTVTIASGGAVDVNGKTMTVNMNIAGAGPDGKGAIVASVGGGIGVQAVTLTADAMVGGPTRWDLRAGNPKLDLGGYVLTTSNAAEVAFVANGNSQITGGGGINIAFGAFAVQNNGGRDVFKNTGWINIKSGAVLLFDYQAATIASGWTITNNNGIIRNVSGGNFIINGPVELIGTTTNDLPADGTINGVISGTGSLKKFGAGALMLSAVNTYSGNTLINTGRVMGVTGGALSTSAVTVTNLGGCGVQVTDITKSWSVGTVTYTTLSNTMDFDFGYLVPSTSLAPMQVTGNLGFNATPSVVIRGGALAVGATYPLVTWSTSSGTIPTTANLVMPAHMSGTLSVSGNTLYLTVGASTLPLTWFPPATAALTNWNINSSTFWKDAIGATGQKYLETTLPGDSVVFDDSAPPVTNLLTVNVAATVTPASVLVNNTTKDYHFTNGVIAGGTALTKSGTGTLTLSTPSTFTGVTTINAGTVIAQTNTAFGATTSGTTVMPGATLDVGGARLADTLNLGAEVFTVSGTGVGGKGAVVNNSPRSQYNAVQKVVLAGNTTIGGVSRWDIRGSATIPTTLDMGGYTLTKIGTNLVSLVYTDGSANPGNIDVLEGTFSMQYTANLGGSLANTLTIASNATFNAYQLSNPQYWSLVLGNKATVYAQSGTAAQNNWAGPVTLYGEALMSDANQYLTLSGDISGASGSLTKIGAGTLTLSGNNTYAGGTVITNGTLVANNSSALGTGVVNINSNAVRLVVGDGMTIANSIMVNGGAGASFRGLIEGNGTLSGGTITINSLTVAGGHFAGTATGPLTVADPIYSTVTVSHRANIGIYSGGGSYALFQITGTGRLGADNGFCTAATIDLCSANAVATLDLAGYSQTLVGISRVNNYAATIANDTGVNDSLLTLTGTSVYPGLIADGASGYKVALAIDSGASLTLSGTNTYTGVTTINAGGTLVLNRSDVGTAPSPIAGSGLLAKDGVGTLTLTGLNTFSGLTVVSNGTLYVRTDATGAGPYAVQDGIGRKLGVILHADAAGLAVSSLTFGSQNRLALELTNATAVLSAPVVTCSGAATLNGDVAVDVTMDAAGSVFPAPTVPTSYLLMTCGSRSGSGAFIGGTLPTFPGFASRILDSGSEVRLAFELPSNDLLWTGNVGPNWNTADINWVLNGTSTATNFATYDTTRFDDTAAGSGTVSVTIPTAVIPGGVTVSNELRDYVFTGNAIAQSASLVKEGVAKLTLANNNTYVGTTAISNGVVEVGNGGTTGSLGTGPVFNEATLVYNRSDSVTNTVAISGIGSLVQNGSGSLSLAVANAYTGNTTVSNGTVNASASAAMGTAGTVMIAPPGTVNASATDAMSPGGVTVDGTLNLKASFAGDVAYTGPATSMSGAGVVNVTLGTNTQTVLLNGNNGGFTGTLNVGTNAVAGAGKIQLNNALGSGATVRLWSNATLFANAVIANPAALVLYGGDPGEPYGQLRLDSGSEWSGPVTLAGDITSTNDGNVGSYGGNPGIISGNISETGGSRTLIKVGGGSITLSGANTYTGGTTNKGGILVANNNAAFGTGQITIVSNAIRLTVNDGFTVTNDIRIDGGAPATGRTLIENSGNGNATLSGGTITINNPLSSSGHFGSVGTGTLTVGDPIVSATQTVAKRLGTVIFSGGGSYTNFSADVGSTVLGANNGLSTAATVDIGISGVANVDLAGYSQTLVGIKRTTANTSYVTNSSTLSDSLLTLTGVSTYPGSLNDANVAGSRIGLQVNGGNLTLGGANAYSGGTLITNAGVITASVAGSLGASPATNYGTLNLNAGQAAGGGDVNYTGLYKGLTGTGLVNVAVGTGTGSSILSSNFSGFTGTINIGTNGATGVVAGAGAGKSVFDGAVGAGAAVNVLSNATLYCRTAVTNGASLVLYGGDTGESLGQLRLEGNANWSGPVTLAGDITGTGDGFLGGNSGGAISGNISEMGGSRAVTKVAAGTLVLSGTNTYTGPTTLNAGTLSVGVTANLGAPAANLVFNGGTLQITGNALTSLSGLGHTVVLTTNTVGLDISSATNTFTADQVLNQGIGGLTKLGLGTLVLNRLNTYSGVTILSVGVTEVASFSNYGVAGGLGQRASSLDVAGGNIGILIRGATLRYSGSTPQSTDRAIRLGTNSVAVIDASGSTPAATLSFTAVSSPNLFENPGTRTLTLMGSNPGANTFALAVTDQAANKTSLTKSGVGTWVLSGTSAYTGPTTISNGILAVTGYLSNTTVTALSGVLAGNGTVGGPVVITANGTLEPGVSTALNETLTLTNTVSLAGTTVMQIGAAGACDKVAGVASITYGGTLLVTNATGAALAPGEVFQLFSVTGTKTGNFANIVFAPALPTGWSSSFDPATGQLVLVAPPTLTYSNTGSALEFSWTGAYKLQVQTNTLDVGISNYWVDYPGGGASPVSVPLDAAQPSVFFRLAQP